MKSYLGLCHITGREATEATVLVFEKAIHIGYRDEQGNTRIERWDLENTVSHYNLSEQATQLQNRLSPSINIQVPGSDIHAYINSLLQEKQKPWFKKRVAQRRAKALAILFGFLGILVASYFILVPWLSGKLASRVSIETEQSFGEAVYNGLGIGAQEDTAASYALNHFFASMEIPSAYQVRVTVIKGEVVNAFALPGGRIVIYDALLRRLQTYPELAALLSHEFIHVNDRHSTKSIFQRLGSRIFLSMLLGNLGAVTTILADQADNLKSLKYSRKLERKADLEGLALLMERKIDPKGFERLFDQLENQIPNEEGPEFLASHPQIKRRMTYISEAAANASFIENNQLKVIFENIKSIVKP